MRPALLLIPAALCWLASDAGAHSGGTNAEGCHNNRKTGDYHCHRGSRLPLPLPLPSAPLPRADPLGFMTQSSVSAENEWLLVVTVFDEADGEVRPTQLLHKPYSTLEACDVAGQNFRSIHAIPDEKKSFSVCVSRAWFAELGWNEEVLK